MERIVEKVKAQIEALLYENATDFEIAKVLKQEIKTYFDTLEDTFATSGGKDFLVKHTKKIDNLLKIVYKIALRSMFHNYTPMKNSIPLALVALGSYGREELCVHSDIDLMIVYKEIPGYNTKEMIEKILYILWDTGLKLGHRVHPIEELFAVSQTDITIKTALIESRFIEGSHFIWVDTENAITKIRNNRIDEFISLKLKEQKKKHRKYPLIMEPNLKEGVGGFRDANLVYWIGKILYNTHTIKALPSDVIDDKEYKPFHISLEFLFRVRSALHLASGKKEDKLRLDLIPRVSELLGYTQNNSGHMKFAQKVTASLKIIRLYSTIWLEVLTRNYIEKETNLNYLIPPDKKTNFHTLLKSLSGFANKPFIAHPTFLKALVTVEKPDKPDKDLNKTVLSLFYQPYCYSILISLSHARLLKYTVPPIKKVVDLPQFDGYHQYAVDIHSIRCIYHLEHIEDVFIKDVFNALTSDEQAMLKIVTFLHDAGKGRKRDHHQLGAFLFKVFAKKLQIDSSLIHMGERLILHHTLMSRIAQREDIYSEKTIMSFASQFPNKKLLDMIYILTSADMSGVGDGVYNSFNAKLIRTLYKHAQEVLDNKIMLDEAAKRSKKESSLKKNPDFLILKKSEQKKILQIPSNLLFLRYHTQRIVDISKRAFETKEYEYHISNEEHLTIEIIRKKNFHLGYFLSKLNNLDVINMDVCKLFDELKYFKIDFAQKIDENEIPLVIEFIHHAFQKRTKTLNYKPIIYQEEITIDCDHSQNYGMMHLKSKNQKGLLALVIETFDALGIDIVTAKVHTLKNRVKDIFLIEKNGNFCHNTDKIIEKLTENISD